MSLNQNEYTFLQTLSDVLSIITITICFILKIPQILNVISVKSAKGLNLIGLLMELTRLFFKLKL